MDLFEILNNAYKKLNDILVEFQGKLKSQNINYTWGFYNNHSIKDNNGNWVTEYFPIPVITIDSLCDIGIDLDFIFVETKMERERAITFDFSSFLPYKFEVYGVCEYLSDFYNDSMDINNIGHEIEQSKENQIGISFFFKQDCHVDDIMELIYMLKSINTFI